MCGRDKSGQPDPAGPPDRTRRRPSRPPSSGRGKDKVRDDREKEASDDPSASEAVTRARKAVAALRRLGLDDSSGL
eukprot:7187754-Pyramimonas_sp.AAC.1